MNKWILSSVLLTINVFAVAVSSPERSSGRVEQVDIYAEKELVATNNKWASNAAYEILQKGGSAIDAAIAAGFMLGLTEPQSSGIGGGGYALVYNNKKIEAYDGREVAPSTANYDWFKKADGSGYMDFNQAHVTPYAVGIPSEVALFQKMHKDYGILPWSKLLQPAIKLANNGFPMSPRLYKLLVSESGICNDSNVKAVYCDATGQVKPVGTLVINKEYAKTLQLIAKSPQSFYTGRIANDIIKAVNAKAEEDLLSKNDFTAYKVIKAKPVCATYRDSYQVCSIPPSSSGGVTILEMIKIYQNLSSTNESNNGKWQYNFLQASKLAFADRNKYIGDPKFVNNPVKGLLDNKYIQSRARLVSESIGLVTPVKYGIPKGSVIAGSDNEPKAHGTTSMVIVDKNKQAITMTVTVENQFGSKIFVDGFFLNNELTDFALNPYDSESLLVANRVEAKKRPRSSIAPVFVLDKKQNLLYALGSPGGSQIICYVAKSLIQMIDFNYTPVEATSSDNLCSVNGPVILEATVNVDKLKTKLQSLEPQPIVITDMVSGEVNVKFTDKHMIGAVDPRREGVVLGQ